MTTLGLFAHPDDEAFGPGGTIAQWAVSDPVYIVCVTNGNDPGKKDNLTQIRAKELRASAQILGVRDVFFLDYNDGTLCNDFYHSIAGTVLEIAQRVNAPRLLTYDNWGVSGHIDHIALAMISNFLFQRNTFFQELWQYTIPKNHFPDRDDYFIYFPPGHDRAEVDEVVRIQDQWDLKIKAIKAHQSQKTDGDRIIERMRDLPREEWFFVKRR
jgi:LmbE family N-acetylglucosaminyl deacetylase